MSCIHKHVYHLFGHILPVSTVDAPTLINLYITLSAPDIQYIRGCDIISLIPNIRSCLIGSWFIIGPIRQLLTFGGGAQDSLLFTFWKQGNLFFFNFVQKYSNKNKINHKPIVMVFNQVIYSFSIFRIAKVYIPFRTFGPLGDIHFGNPSVLKLYITLKNHDICSMSLVYAHQIFSQCKYIY